MYLMINITFVYNVVNWYAVFLILFYFIASCVVCSLVS